MSYVSKYKPALTKNPDLYLKMVEAGSIVKYDPQVITVQTNPVLASPNTPVAVTTDALPYDILVGEWLLFEDSTTGQVSLLKVTTAATASDTSVTGLLSHDVPVNATATHPVPIGLINSLTRGKEVATSSVDYFSTVDAVQLPGEQTNNLSMSGYWNPLSPTYRTIQDAAADQQFYLRVELEKVSSRSASGEVNHYLVTAGSTEEGFEKNAATTASYSFNVIEKIGVDYEA